jgi:hypothetical protein
MPRGLAPSNAKNAHSGAPAIILRYTCGRDWSNYEPTLSVSNSAL